MFKKIFIVISVSILLISISGCSVEKADKNKQSDLEFTVVKDEVIPKELKRSIEEKQESEFKLTYTEGEYLYIAIGYGEQETSGYSIQVNELYTTSNAIYLDTTLLGPKKDETVHETLTYPYLVLKTEYLDKKVIFL
ncbi:protease complex subunit PrcB family protein [Anaerosacchariphilus polymeriproducens]|uniref:protease complex subunit PrcB family protein n=1 Tax=Anaerosacchariphilus polymeriproducens TaxID=1812858 RepID=UPI001F298B98|nr:protease complex subunit PrcB family protein [Anaerosacchariphilus polymeriproducens]